MNSIVEYPNYLDGQVRKEHFVLVAQVYVGLAYV